MNYRMSEKSLNLIIKWNNWLEQRFTNGGNIGSTSEMLPRNQKVWDSPKSSVLAGVAPQMNNINLALKLQNDVI